MFHTGSWEIQSKISGAMPKKAEQALWCKSHMNSWARPAALGGSCCWRLSTHLLHTTVFSQLYQEETKIILGKKKKSIANFLIAEKSRNHIMHSPRSLFPFSLPLSSPFPFTKPAARHWSVYELWTVCTSKIYSAAHLVIKYVVSPLWWTTNTETFT